MDDLIKILQKLMSESPKPKGGIADTAEGIEFIGRKLTKDEIGGNAIIGSKLTDASAFKPFSVRNVGIENRYSLLREYGDDLAKKFEETITFIKNNPDVRFSQVQKDNILYNLGVYRRVVAEKDKIAKGLTEQGKNVDDIFNNRVDNLPDEMLTMDQVLEKFQSNVKKMKEKIDEITTGTPKKELDERELRLKRLYDGPGYDRSGSSLYRGYGSFFLPKLHEKGIIKLDDQIYNNLKEGQHHWGGADYYAPDPVRIWRKHFGNEVFEKLDNFNPDNEDIFQWLERNNVQPIQKDGPKNALEYMTSTEVQQRLADETSSFGKYKNPESAGDDAQFYYRDKPSQRMERITYHGENIGALEQALQTIDPDSYKEYFRTKPTYDSKVLPFKELNAEGGRVGFGDGSGYIPGGYTDDAYEYLREIDEEIFQSFVKYKQGGGKMKYGPYAYNAKRMMFGSFGVGKLRKAEGGRVGFFKGAVASGENISPGTDVGGNVRDDNPFTGGGGGDGPKGPPSVINPPPKQETGINILKNRSKFAFNNAQKFLNDLKNYGSIAGTYFGAMLPGRLGEYATGIMRTSAMNQNLKNILNKKMTTGPTFDDLSGNISYADFGLPQGYDVRPTYDTEGRIESWSKVPNTRFVAPSLKEMAEMDSAALANALTIGNVGYEKDLDTGKISFTGTEYDDIGSKIFDTKPTEIPINFKEGGRVGFQGGGRDASQFDFDPGPGEISSDAGFANTGKSLATQEIKEAPQVFDIGTVGDPSQNPGSINVGGGIDYRPSFDQPTFFEQALGTGQKIINNPFVRTGIFSFLPPQIQKLGQIFAIANSLKTVKNIYDQSIDESLKTSLIDGLIPYDKVIEKEIEGDVTGPKPIDTESIVTKKLEGLIPEGTDLRTEAEKEADYFTNLKENYFPNRELFNRFMMMDPDPKVEKDLLNLKNLDVQLTYPDQKVLNEEGFLDKEKLKSTVDQAEIVGTTNVGPFTFSRNIDTEGEGITSGSFDTKYLNIDSPNLEENQYSLTAKAPLQNIDLSSTFNVQDGNVTDQRYDLNMDGLEGSYKIGDGFSTRNLELDKNFTVGNFDFGVDGMYSDYNSNDYNRYSSTFTPSVSYSQNIGDGILTSSIAKEIIQGGDVPNLSFAGSYPVMGGQLTGSLTNVLSDNMGATVGYDYKMGSPNLNNYLELKARANPFNLRDSALYFGLKKEF